MAGSACPTGEKVGLQVAGPFDGIQGCGWFLQGEQFIREGFQVQAILFLMVIGLFGWRRCATRMAEYRHWDSQKEGTTADPAPLLLVA